MGVIWYDEDLKAERTTEKRNGNVECPLFFVPRFRSPSDFHITLDMGLTLALRRFVIEVKLSSVLDPLKYVSQYVANTLE